MRNDLDLDLFYQAVRKESDRIDDLNEPVLPRKRLQPNYSILQFMSGHEAKSELQLKNTLKLFTSKPSMLFITH